jgi:hypothetical protein
MIASEESEKKPKITLVTCEGMKIIPNAMNQGNKIDKWVRKDENPSPLFDPGKEKETYKQSRKEVIGGEWIALTLNVPPLYVGPLVYDMPLVYDHMHTERKFGKVSSLQFFLKSCVVIMKDGTTLRSLGGIIDHYAKNREEVIVQLEVNQVHQKTRTHMEF